jgi:DNA-binding response OmpR family regulator
VIKLEYILILGDKMSAKILLVEDDVFLRDGLQEILEKEGYNIETVSCIADAEIALKSNNYNLLILDVMLPDGNGFDLCSSIREKSDNIPILFLTACDDEIQVVRGLDSGADDYVTKPFKLLELLSRVRALLRRNVSSVYKSGDISIDINTMTVKKNNSVIFVTPTEFQILSVLVRNNGVIVTRSVLLQNIWDDAGNYIDDNTLSVHISRLREKIGNSHIKTVRGVGYRWEEN